ncbi:hypothetical protein [Priestia megaterium]|jgi:DNA-binding transcriptional MerR regulator|uniref:hypothetical protein n=2 Tax=Priestia megaterium TaxID=1404 RepID=UPI000BFBA166|nr:hypothetical protein [Priestia megaterium]MBY0200270.1 hypothetical protein [Priestia megaterium]MCT9853085.1 hypothetical protein [Priestia megaterium]MDF1960878.1 hypothetical protein [Priestia megaterium]PGN59899.1 hypothetical protein CN978_27540 [Priestia megaterium]PGQ87682.1 hypothetical protein COA18_07590 [Priestia megaterium]
MENDTTRSEKAYWTNEVAKRLDIAVTTVRKYATLMEKHNYKFIRNEHDQRAFLERDIIVLTNIQSLSKSPGITLEEAVKTVLEDIPKTPVSPPDIKENDQLQAIIKQYGNEFTTLKNENAELKNMMLELQDMMREQKEYIAVSLEKRDKQITEFYKKTIEEKQERKKSWFQRLFNN